MTCCKSWVASCSCSVTGSWIVRLGPRMVGCWCLDDVMQSLDDVRQVLYDLMHVLDDVIKALDDMIQVLDDVIQVMDDVMQVLDKGVLENYAILFLPALTSPLPPCDLM